MEEDWGKCGLITAQKSDFKCANQAGNGARFESPSTFVIDDGWCGAMCCVSSRGSIPRNHQVLRGLLLAGGWRDAADDSAFCG